MPVTRVKVSHDDVDVDAFAQYKNTIYLRTLHNVSVVITQSRKSQPLMIDMLLIMLVAVDCGNRSAVANWSSPMIYIAFTMG